MNRLIAVAVIVATSGCAARRVERPSSAVVMPPGGERCDMTESTPLGVEPPDDLNAPPADAERSASGLVSRRLSEGCGVHHPGSFSVVRAHYSGWTLDGKMFDSSVTRGEPARFSLNAVIPGWREGVKQMVVGERRRLWIPENLAYKGMPGPQGALVFDIELVEIVEF